jgi:hypothetical protein
MSFGGSEDTVRLHGAHYLDVTINAAIGDTTATSVSIDVVDPEGNVETDYEGTATFVAYDDNGSYASPNVDLSTDGSTYTESVQLTFTAGQWSGNLYFDLPASSSNPITLAGQYDTEVNGYQPSGRGQRDSFDGIVYEDTDRTYASGEDPNSPFTGQTWTLYDDSSAHGFSDEGDGLGWTASANGSGVKVYIIGTAETPDQGTTVTLKVYVDDVYKGDVTREIYSSGGYTTTLETAITSGQTVKTLLDQNYTYDGGKKLNVIQIDHAIILT